MFEFNFRSPSLVPPSSSSLMWTDLAQPNIAQLEKKTKIPKIIYSHPKTEIFFLKTNKEICHIICYTFPKKPIIRVRLKDDNSAHQISYSFPKKLFRFCLKELITYFTQNLLYLPEEN